MRRCARGLYRRWGITVTAAASVHSQPKRQRGSPRPEDRLFTCCTQYTPFSAACQAFCEDFHVAVAAPASASQRSSGTRYCASTQSQTCPCASMSAFCQGARIGRACLASERSSTEKNYKQPFSKYALHILYCKMICYKIFIIKANHFLRGFHSWKHCQKTP